MSWCGAGTRSQPSTRGITEAKLPREVRRLYADRKNHPQLKEVLSSEDFDVVFDISAYVLEDVESMVDIFEGRTGTLHLRQLHGGVRRHQHSAHQRGLSRGQHSPAVRLWAQQANLRGLSDEGFQAAPLSLCRLRASQWSLGRTTGSRTGSRGCSFVCSRVARFLCPGRGTTLSQVGHVDDEARAMRMMALNPRTYGEIYNITGKDYFSDEGYVDTCAKGRWSGCRQAFRAR